MGYNMRDFMAKGFVRKEDLRQSGPRRFTVEKVEMDPGRDWGDGKPPIAALVLVFTDGSRFALRAQQNQRRMAAAYGEHTDGWKGKEVELYYTPDVTSSRGEPGGIRVRIPGAEGAPASAPAPRATRPVRIELADEDDEKVPF